MDSANTVSTCVQVTILCRDRNTTIGVVLAIIRTYCTNTHSSTLYTAEKAVSRLPHKCRCAQVLCSAKCEDRPPVKLAGAGRAMAAVTIPLTPLDYRSNTLMISSLVRTVLLYLQQCKLTRVNSKAL